MKRLIVILIVASLAVVAGCNPYATSTATTATASGTGGVCGAAQGVKWP